MKTIKIILIQVLICLLAVWPVLANLTVTVQPGYTFSPGEVPTLDTLNLLGMPVLDVTGTLDGSTSLSAGSVNGILLADSVVDDVTIGYNSNVPRGMQVIGAGIAGKGMTNDTPTSVSVNIDQSLAYTVGTNAGTPFYYTGVNLNWLQNVFWHPWLVWQQPTNSTYTNAFWGYTNVQLITNIVVAGFAPPTLTATDEVPVLAWQQGSSNAPATLGAIAQFVDANNLKLVSTITVSGTIKSNDVVNAIALTDATGQHSVMGTAFPVTATTNLTTAFMATNLAAAINGTPSTPKYRAVPSGSTIQIYEPLVFYPYSGSSAQFTFTTGLSLALTGVSATMPPLFANVVPTATVQSSGVTSGAQAYLSSNLVSTVSGGVPPYTYLWTGTFDSKISVFTIQTTVAASTTFTCVFNPAGIHGTPGVSTFNCRVTDNAGQVFNAPCTYTYLFP